MTVNQIDNNFRAMSGVANFCTISLFFIFVVGKIWVLMRNRSLYNENFEHMVVASSEEFEKQFVLDENSQDTIKISSSDGIFDVKIYEIEEIVKRKVVKKRKIADKIEDGIIHPLKLNKNEAVYIRTNLPCGWPNYQIEITKYDYVKIVTELGNNGKVGGITLENLKIRYGIRSFLYYLCK